MIVGQPTIKIKYETTEGAPMQREKGVFKPTKLTLVAILLSSMLILMGGAAVAPALNDIKQAFPAVDSSGIVYK